MIFHEIYSVYYNTVAKILGAVIEGEATDKDLQKIVTDNAFGESALTILPSLKARKWQLVDSNLSTPIEHIPTMPLTTLEKRWLKSISEDPRIKLFGVKFDGLDDVEPLFTQDDYCVFDKYSDGDPFDDEKYIRHFSTVLEAVKHQLPINLETVNRKGRTIFVRCLPTKLEYSEKDDKFRVFTRGCKYVSVLNLAKITSCHIYTGDKKLKDIESETETETALLEIINYRNALERVLMHFAHFEKETQAIGDNKYRLRMNYDRNDEIELVIRILSFGPFVKVLEPESLSELIKEKLKQQRSCGLVL